MTWFVIGVIAIIVYIFLKKVWKNGGGSLGSDAVKNGWEYCGTVKTPKGMRVTQFNTMIDGKYALASCLFSNIVLEQVGLITVIEDLENPLFFQNFQQINKVISDVIGPTEVEAKESGFTLSGLHLAKANGIPELGLIFEHVSRDYDAITVINLATGERGIGLSRRNSTEKPIPVDSFEEASDYIY